MENNGYLVVASRKSSFYSLAINLIESIKDYNPDANCCLVAEERFIDTRADCADHIIHCDDHVRAKLYGMTKTPYDKTMYIDADCEVVHEDIAKCFDELKDFDVMFTHLSDDRKYIFKEVFFPAGRLELCGGVCLYDYSKQIVKDFLQDWWDLHQKQVAGEWWPTKEFKDWRVASTEDKPNWDDKQYPRTLSRWDQFSLWWLTKKDPKYCDEALKVGIFEDDIRWNWYTSYDPNRNQAKSPVVIEHYSNMAPKNDDLYAVNYD